MYLLTFFSGYNCCLDGEAVDEEIGAFSDRYIRCKGPLTNVSTRDLTIIIIIKEKNNSKKKKRKNYFCISVHGDEALRVGECE